MRLHIQRFTAGVLSIALASLAMAAFGGDAASVEKARQAVRVLQSGSPAAEKALACKQLAIYGTPEAVPVLAPLLADEPLAAWARIALEAIPGPAADDALRQALDKLQGRLLVGVINSIGVRRDAKAVDALAGKLAAADPEVAAAAAVALGRIGGERAAKLLEKSLSMEPAVVRSAVAEGLILCAEQALAGAEFTKAAGLYEAVRNAQVPRQRVIEATRGLILARQARGLPLLLETLRSPDWEMFGLGLRTARELSGREVTEALAAELGKTPPDRQGPLLLAIGDRHDAAVVPAVLAAARSGSKPLQLAAIEMMARQGNAGYAPALLDAVVGTDPELTQAAKAALTGLPGRELDEKLVARMAQVTGNARRVLVELAGQRHVSSAVPELVKAANDADPGVRMAAIKALGGTVGVAELDALTALLAKATSEDVVTAIQDALESACVRLPDKGACADRLLAGFAGSAAPIQCVLLRVLGGIGSPRALEAARAALARPEPALRDTAVRVLADWPEAAALPALLEIFRTTKEETHRFLALRGCVRLLELEGHSQQVVKTYGELLAGTQRPDDRKVILSGLGKVTDVAALKLVETLLGDAQVQAEAELALLNIAAGIAKTAPADARAAATRLQNESKQPATRDRATKLLGELGGQVAPAGK